MTVLREIRYRARQVITPVIGACVVGYFVYHSVQGDRGVLSYLRLNNEVKRAAITLAAVSQQREDLEQKVGLLHPLSLDTDMLEERARLSLNIADPNDVVIMGATSAN